MGQDQNGNQKQPLIDAYKKAARKLHHLSMRYCGAFVELLSGKQVGLIASGHPGLKETRDFIDLILYTRAEINGLCRLLVDAKIITVEQLNDRMAIEYELFAKTKAEYLGVEVFDGGIKIKV